MLKHDAKINDGYKFLDNYRERIAVVPIATRSFCNAKLPQKLPQISVAVGLGLT